MNVTADLLAQAGVLNPAHWVAPLTSACLAQQITTPQRLAGFLANVLHESMNLSRVCESLDYTPPRLRQIWPQRFSVADADRMARTVEHPADQRAIAERAYGGRMGNRAEGSGDGWAFRGRGPMQVTGRDGYEVETKATGLDLMAVGAWLETPEGGCLSAARYWSTHGCNGMADRMDVTGFRQAVNGGLLGIDEVTARWRTLLGVLGVSLTARPLSPGMQRPPVGVVSRQQSVADDAATADALNQAEMARIAQGGG